ncbi:MAG: tRNA (guanosine(46)-N7)-methyltransferase TrmB [Alphaproteobacteria bacterium]
MNEVQKDRLIFSFSRRVGRTLSDTQKAFLKNELHKFTIKNPQGINPAKLFNFQPKEIWFEIGFGSGEHIATLAEQNKDIGFIGCEPFLNGVANLLNHIVERNISNIRIWQNDARLLLGELPDNILQRVYILFPDPWPKLKHHKRRIISDLTLNLLATKIVKGGKLIVATDHKEYAGEMEKTLNSHQEFTPFVTDYKLPPEGWVKTRYQEKAEALNLQPYFFQFIRK